MFNNKLPMMARLFVAVCFLSYFTSFIECSPLQKTSSLETCVSIVKRQQCAYAGCSQYQCEQEGCCYNKNAKPFCFFPRNSTTVTGYCDQNVERVTCGDSGEYVCKEEGCCWDTTKGQPYCYRPKDRQPRPEGNL